MRISYSTFMGWVVEVSIVRYFFALSSVDAKIFVTVVFSPVFVAKKVKIYLLIYIAKKTRARCCKSVILLTAPFP